MSGKRGEAHGNACLVAETLDSVGHPHVVLGQHEQAHAVWREALELYREQGRDTDAQRLQQHLHNLDNPTKHPPRQHLIVEEPRSKDRPAPGTPARV